VIRFVGAGGSITDSCSNAIVFQQSQGQLIGIHNGEPIAVDPGVPHILLSPAPGSISTDFEITHSLLDWVNSSFFNGFAGFCQLDDEIYATFTAAGGPGGADNCEAIQLMAYPR
jgi:hypothetical protein